MVVVVPAVGSWREVRNGLVPLLLPLSLFGVDESLGFPKFRDRITSGFWLRVHGIVGGVDCITCNRVKVV